MSASPFDDFRNLLRHLPEPDRAAEAKARDRVGELAAGQGEMGSLGGLAVWHAAWQGRVPPMILRPTIAVFAGSTATGDVAANIAATKGMVENAAAGKTAVNALCGLHNLALKVLDLALDLPVGDITVQPAFDARGAAATMAFGMEAVAGGADLLGFSDFGRGNAVHVGALALALVGLDADVLADPIHGETVQEASSREKLSRRAHDFHKGDIADPFEALARLGTREIAAIAGAILAARMERIPVLLDGMAALGAAMVLHAADPRTLAHCRLAHRLPGAYGRAAALIGLDPVLDLGLGLTGGAGAVLAASLTKSAAQILVDAG